MLKLSGNVRPQSSWLAEPLWTDPGIKCGISVHEPTSSSKNNNKKQKKHRWGIVEHSPQILASKEKATTTTTWPLFNQLPSHNLFLSACLPVCLSGKPCIVCAVKSTECVLWVCVSVLFTWPRVDFTVDYLLCTLWSQNEQWCTSDIQTPYILNFLVSFCLLCQSCTISNK